MNHKTPVSDIKQAIEQLIQAGTSFDIHQLELIYHKNLQVIIIEDEGKITTADKAAFKQLFETKRDQGDPPLNTWAEFHHIQTHGQNGHVVLSRKVQLMEVERKLTLSIDLVWEDHRWQVVREVIFSRPVA